MENRIAHMKLPVMIGSNIDLIIRENCMEKNDNLLLGAIVTDTGVKQVVNFLTNNLKNGYAYCNVKTNTYHFRMNVSTDSHTMKLIYNQTQSTKSQADEPNDDEEQGDVEAMDETTTQHADEATKPDETTTQPRKYCRKLPQTRIKPSLGVGEKLPQFHIEITDDNKIAAAKSNNTYTGKAPFITTLDNLSDAFDFIQKTSLLPPEWTQNVTPEDYLEYFDSSITDPLPLDSLANKTVLIGPVILYRMYDRLNETYQLKRRQQQAAAEAAEASATPTTATGRKRRNTALQKTDALSAALGNMFNSGNGYFALNAKKHIKMASEFSRSVYLVVEGEKLDQLPLNLSVVKRFSNTQTLMSKALLFPKDGKGYLCTTAIKELVGAGETLYLTQGCISSPPFTLKTVLQLLNKLLPSVPKPTADAPHCYRLVFESFLSDRFVPASFFVTLKKELPFLYLRIIDGKFLNIQYTGSILMRFSNRYQIYIAPGEQSMFPGAFVDESPYRMFSEVFGRIPANFQQAQPAKISVSLSNIRGSMCEIRSRLMCQMLLNSVGYNSILFHTLDEYPLDVRGVFCKNGTPLVTTSHVRGHEYLKLAYIPPDDSNYSEMPKVLRQIDWSRKPNGNNRGLVGVALKDIYSTRDLDTMESLIRTHIPDVPVCVMKVDPNTPHFAMSAVDSRYSFFGIDPTKVLENRLKLDRDTPLHNQLLVWCAIGDIAGATNEDGILLDETFCREGPCHLNMATFNIKFLPDTVTEKRRAASYSKPVNHRHYVEINLTIGPFIFYGMLVTREKLLTNASKNLHVLRILIGETIQYWIYSADYTPFQKIVNSYFNGTDVVSLHYRYFRPMGVGTKIANVHGQKNVVSMVKCLKYKRMWTRDGHCVHPQLLMSPSSILGRNIASQITEMLSSDLVAFNEFQEFCAPIAVNIHNIDPGVKMRISKPKIDLMTSENGFLANRLSYLLKLMGEQANNRNDQRLEFLLEIAKLSEINIEFLDSSALEIVKLIRTPPDAVLDPEPGDNIGGDSDDDDEGQTEAAPQPTTTLNEFKVWDLTSLQSDCPPALDPLVKTRANKTAQADDPDDEDDEDEVDEGDIDDDDDDIGDDDDDDDDLDDIFECGGGSGEDED